MITIKDYRHQSKRVRRSGLGGFNPPPPNRKNCCRKLCYFRRLSFLRRPIAKLDTNSSFLLDFHQRFSQNFPKHCVFRRNAQRFNAYFWIFNGKNRLKSCIFCNFLKRFFASFLKFSGVREAPPRDPLLGRPNLWTFPDFFLCTPLFVPAYLSPSHTRLTQNFPLSPKLDRSLSLAWAMFLRKDVFFSNNVEVIEILQFLI